MRKSEWWIAETITNKNRVVVEYVFSEYDLVQDRVYLAGSKVGYTLQELTDNCELLLVRPLDISKGSDDCVNK